MLEPLAVLVGMVIFELMLLAVALVLLESGWKPSAPNQVPAPVTNYQLPDVPGDGS